MHSYTVCIYRELTSISGMLNPVVCNYCEFCKLYHIVTFLCTASGKVYTAIVHFKADKNILATII